jgi:GT2 family glycosyltransferase
MSLRISVVVPTVGRPYDLEQCLRALVTADNGALYEVIVVDDEAPRPVEVAPALAERIRVTVLRNEIRVGAAVARNRAAEKATGDVLAFVDDDARVLPDWFDVACAELTDDRVAITGRVLPFDVGLVSRARQWRYDQRYRRTPGGAEVGFLAGGNSLVRRAEFLAAGGFPDQPTAADNALVPRLAAAGGRCCFVPGLRVLHRNGKGFATAMREAWRAGVANPVPPGRALTAFAGTLLALPARRQPDVALVNGALQVCNTLGQLTGAGSGKGSRP